MLNFSACGAKPVSLGPLGGLSFDMTYHVTFYAERAFLRFLKKTLSHYTEDDFSADIGCACILAAAAALEASINDLLQSDGRLRHYDELSILSKLETVADWGGVSIAWGNRPWQDVKQLIRIRNWLAHFKDSYVGLTTSSGTWVNDLANKPPKIDPYKELSRKQVESYYQAVRLAIDTLIGGLRPGAESIEAGDRGEDEDIFFVG